MTHVCSTCQDSMSESSLIESQYLQIKPSEGKAEGAHTSESVML